MILHDRLENVIYDNGTHIDLNMHNNVSIDQVLSCIHFIYISLSFLIDGKEEWTPLPAYIIHILQKFEFYVSQCKNLNCNLIAQ